MNTELQRALDFAYGNGLLRLHPQGITHIPFSLRPSKFSQALFLQANDLAYDNHALYHKVVTDEDYISSIVEPIAHSDSFVHRLYQIYLSTKNRHNQALSLNCYREDYFQHQDESGLKLQQIEVNTISSAYAASATTITELHQYLSDAWQQNNQQTAPVLPDNQALSGVIKGIAEAWYLYNNESAVICFVVMADECNRFDQRKIEYLLQDYGIRVIYKTFSELSAAQLRGSQDRLWIEQTEVAVVYYRTAYRPSHYKTEEDWRVRELIEQSYAIKCPSMAFHLAGLKAIQADLTQPTTLSKLGISTAAKKNLLQCFARQYPLNEKSIQLLQDSPEHYVLKPQREGGGNNYFGQAMIKQVKTLKKETYHAWVVMQNLSPKVVTNQMVRQNKRSEEMPVTSELGIFSVAINDAKQLLYSQMAGHLLRTKPLHSNEGGVSSGSGVLDSPSLQKL